MEEKINELMKLIESLDQRLTMLEDYITSEAIADPFKGV